jgi:hypothetical protein
MTVEVSEDVTTYVIEVHEPDTANVVEVFTTPIGSGSGIGGLVVVDHGTDGSLPRPDAPLVYWVGSATPANALPYDLWME